jgi:UDP-N-acetyl-D-galactosamine dehydrogenase
VLAAARTKWNFLPFTPGLVGGHCIGVDPYYLTYKAETLGYHPQIILAGRRINDGAGVRIARECVKLLLRNGGGRNVTVLGLTFKENVPDIRNSRVVDIITELASHNLNVQVTDPLADPAEVKHEYGLDLVPQELLAPADAVILAVPHEVYARRGWEFITRYLAPQARVVVDVKSCLDLAARPEQIILWRM